MANIIFKKFACIWILSEMFLVHSRCTKIKKKMLKNFAIFTTWNLCWGQIFHKTWNLFHWQLAPHQQIMDFGKTSFKAQNSHINKMTPKPMVQNPWRYYLIKAHSSSSWHNISFSTHDPSLWISSKKFWELWFGGTRSMFSKTLVVQSW